MDRGGPAKVLWPFYSSLAKNIFQIDFIIRARNCFHHHENSLREFSTLWRPNDMEFQQYQLILHKKSNENN